MCKELMEIYDTLSADHKNELMVVAKTMKNIEDQNQALKNLLAISK